MCVCVCVCVFQKYPPPLLKSLSTEIDCSNKYKRSCGRADSEMDSHITGPAFKTRLLCYFLQSFLLTTTIPEKVERSLVCVCV